jgi:Zinc-binding dehydrogenase
MDALAALASAGKLQQRIARTLPLDQAAQAHELGESGRAGDYSPAGSGLSGDLACFRDNKAAYLEVSGKRELFQVWDTLTEFVRETHLCPHYARRSAHAGYRGGFPDP